LVHVLPYGVFQEEIELCKSKYLEFLQAKRTNYLGLIKKSNETWLSFQQLDEILASELEDLEVMSSAVDLFPLMLYARSLAAFRFLIPLAFSGAILEAGLLMRSCVESAVFAHKLKSEPTLVPIFMGKASSPNGKKLFHASFVANRKSSLFSGSIELDELYEFWSSYSEISTHANATDLSLRYQEFGKTDTHQQIGVHFFERNEKILGMAIFQLLRTSELVEKVLYSDFELRLNLDNNLQGKRDRFANTKERVRLSMIQKFKLVPNYQGLPVT